MSQTESPPMSRSPWERLRSGGSGTAMATLALTGLITAVAFLANVVTSRMLGPTGRGELALVLQLSYLLWPVLLGGADRLVLSGHVGSKWPTARYSVVVLGIVGLASVLFVAWRHPHPWYLLWLAPVLLAESYATVSRAESLAKRRPWLYAKWVLMCQSGILAGLLLLGLLGADSSFVWGLLWGWPALLVLVWLARNLRRAHVDRDTLITSLRLLPGASASLVLLRSERLFLPLISGTASLGVYVAIATMIEFASLPGTVLADMWSNREVRPRATAYAAVLGLTAVVSGAVGAATYVLIPHLFGEAFVGGRNLILPLCLGSVVLVGYRFVIARALASPQPATSSRIELVGAATALILYPVAVVVGDAEGAAWGSLLVYFISAAAGIVILQRRRTRLVTG